MSIGSVNNRASSSLFNQAIDTKKAIHNKDIKSLAKELNHVRNEAREGLTSKMKGSRANGTLTSVERNGKLMKIIEKVISMKEKIGNTSYNHNPKKMERLNAIGKEAASIVESSCNESGLSSEKTVHNKDIKSLEKQFNNIQKKINDDISGRDKGPASSLPLSRSDIDRMVDRLSDKIDATERKLESTSYQHNSSKAERLNKLSRNAQSLQRGAVGAIRDKYVLSEIASASNSKSRALDAEVRAERGEGAYNGGMVK